MLKIDLELIKTLVKGEKVNVSWYNRDNEVITKKCTFHSIEDNIILVKPPRSKKRAWEIPINSQTRIERIT